MARLLALLMSAPAVMYAVELASPYYISPRSGAQHIALSEDWELAWRDHPAASPAEIASQAKWIRVARPSSVQMALHYAGELPHPYYNLNSQKYSWVDEKVWYYRKSIQVPAEAQGRYLFLVFDGIDYFARVWLNGQLLGEHEGMFGGPAIEVSKAARYGGANEIVVEVRAGNWGRKSKFNWRNPGRIIRPWVISGGVGAEMFFPLGMWQGARLEIVPKLSMERPFLVTKSVTGQAARLHLSVEVLSGTHSLEQELHPWNNAEMRYSRDWWKLAGLDGITIDFALLDRNSGKPQYRKTIAVKGYSGGRNFIDADIDVPAPRLWWPAGMGEPHLYTAELQLKQKGTVVDRITFDYGIRTLATERTPGPRMYERWSEWQFAVNGRRFFVKGINWMPADILLDLPRERYRWLLKGIQNAGIQMVRVWGGGILEPEQFYDIANELGILVWQDFPIGNVFTPEFPQRIWEAQVMQNIFRLRNHPALAVWCGGNEFNPYGEGNAASIGILERSLAEFDPTRPFRRTSPDNGSMHDYTDMDPTWYARKFPYLPFMAEAGMHNVPNGETMREVISPAEMSQTFGNMYSKEFEKDFPDFRHHFVEFLPSRVPRMLSRASHIDDMAAPTIEMLAEGTQIGAGEFYQVMSEALQANYPVTSGLMPWMYKRPWPAVAIQLMDGFGQPTAPYYFLKRTYEERHVLVRLPHLLWAAGESIPLQVAVTNAKPAGSTDLTASIEVRDDSFRTLWRRQTPLGVKAGPSVSSATLGDFVIPAGYQDRFLFVVAELRDSAGKLISRSVYWPRSLAVLAEPQTRAKFRSAPVEWPALTKGPWLKPTTGKTRTALSVEVVSARKSPEGNTLLGVRIRNAGSAPSFLTRLDVQGARRAFIAGDNFFWLGPGETRTIPVEVHWRAAPPEAPRVLASSWNADAVTASFAP